MKKILSLLLTLCLLFSILPAQALAAVGDIRPVGNNGSGDGKRRPHGQADAVLLLRYLWLKAHHASGKPAPEKPDLCEQDAQRHGKGHQGGL